MILVDSNVVLDIITVNQEWQDWSDRHISQALLEGDVVIDDVVFAEVSVRFGTLAEVDLAIERLGLVIAAIPRPALFLAGKAFARYRGAGGGRTGVLPDFFIGAHALVLGVPLLTRDARRYRSYFPELALIAP